MLLPGCWYCNIHAAAAAAAAAAVWWLAQKRLASRMYNHAVPLNGDVIMTQKLCG